MPVDELVEVERVVKNKLEPLISEIEHVFSHNPELQKEFQDLNQGVKTFEESVARLRASGNISKRRIVKGEEKLIEMLEDIDRNINNIDRKLEYDFLPRQFAQNTKNEINDIKNIIVLIKKELKISEHFENGEIDKKELKSNIQTLKQRTRQNHQSTDFQSFKTTEEYREKIIFRFIKQKANDKNVIEKSLFKFSLDPCLQQLQQKIGLNPELSTESPKEKEKWQRTGTKLSREGYQHSVDIKFGQSRKRINFVAASYSQEIVDQYVRQKLNKRLHEVEKEYENVNHQLEVLQSVKEDAKQSNLPTYNSSMSKINKLADFYVKEMLDYVEEHLDLKISFDLEEDYDIKKHDKFTRYTGTYQGVHRIDLMSVPKNRADFYPTDFKKLVSYFENAPTGVQGQEADNVPHRAPDVLVIDLLHEIGHMVSNLIVEEKGRQQGKEYSDKYGMGGDFDPVTKELGSSKSEKTANELALAIAKRLRTMGGTYKEIMPGFEAYLELTKYDNPNEGYTSQHPIRADRDTVKELFEIDDKSK